MRRRGHEGSLGRRHGEPQRVVDGSCGDFIVPRQAGKDRQARSICRGPGIGTLLVDGHVPRDGRIGAPASALAEGGVVKLVEPATVFLEHQHMSVAVAGFGIALDQRIGRNRHGPGIALAGEGAERNVDLGLRARHHLVGNPDGLPLEDAGAKVRMQRDGRADEVDDVGGIEVHIRPRDVGVPQAARRERNEAVQVRSGADAHPAAGPALRKGDAAKQQYHCGYQKKFRFHFASMATSRIIPAQTFQNHLLKTAPQFRQNVP